MQSDPIFITEQLCHALHRSGLALHGGSGTPDLFRLDAALHQVKHSWHYGNLDYFGIAAAYADYISRGHAFTHGNKTAAALTALTFLEKNGVRADTSTGTLYNVISGLANNSSKEELASIFCRRLSGSV